MQYRWHWWQHFIWWHKWYWWLPCRSCGRFIMPTEKTPTTGTGTDMPTLQAFPRTTHQVHKMPTPPRKMPSLRHSRIPIGIRSFQDHSPVLTGPSVPASRTTKSSGRLIPITGPSSPTKGQPARQDTQSWINFHIDCNALQDHASYHSTSIPFQDHFGLTVHFQTFQDQQLLEQLWIYNCYRGISAHISNFFKTIQSTNIEGTLQHLPFVSSDIFTMAYMAATNSKGLTLNQELHRRTKGHGQKT